MNRVFIDTNVLIYADQPHAAFHTIARNALIAFEGSGG
jgi:predicted nucleic acid-binding protein